MVSDQVLATAISDSSKGLPSMYDQNLRTSPVRMAELTTELHTKLALNAGVTTIQYFGSSRLSIITVS